MAQYPQRHGGGPQGRGGNRPPGGGRSPNVIPDPQTVHYHLDGKPNPKLMDDDAQALGEALANQDQLKPSQLRRYYDDVLTLRNRLDVMARKPGPAREDAFALLRADFKMLKAKAAYAHGRQLIPQRLLQFFVNHVHSVQSANDFDVFCRHFQAVVAFHKFYKPKD